MNVKRIFAFFGPAYLVSIGYMDPGNWATDIAGGSRYGYTLLWVLLVSNISAIVLQSLCARVGLVTNKDLAQITRAIYPKYANYGLYFLAELAIIATDLAEVLGMALGLNLLFNIPLIWGVSITVADTFIFLMLIKYGARVFEALIICFIVIIASSLIYIAIIGKPDGQSILLGLIPSIPDKQSLYLITGIIGATIMPHNLYLHSSLVKNKIKNRVKNVIKKAIFWSTIDSAIALNLAFFVNGALLVIAASLFFVTARYDISDIRDAHALLEPLLNSTIAPTLFAIALIVAGQSSTLTGTMAGQVVMDGHLKIKIRPVYRRLITRLLAVIPAVFVIYISGEENIIELLVLSQVFLSLQLGFAIIPLLFIVSNKRAMGAFSVSQKMLLPVYFLGGLLVYLNVEVVTFEASNAIRVVDNGFFTFFVYAFLSFSGVLFFYAIYFPLKNQNTEKLVNNLKFK